MTAPVDYLKKFAGMALAPGNKGSLIYKEINMATNIPMQHRGKRPRFFAAEGMDEMMSMVLELTSEVWAFKAA